MKQQPPFLPGLSPKLQGRQRRRQLEVFQQIRRKALQASITDLGALFHDILPVDWLSGIASDVRKRCFPQVVVFWAWISQVLEQNGSCAKAVTLIQKWSDLAGVGSPSFDTSSYCKARLRLPDDFLDLIDDKIEAYAEARVEDHHLWYGRRLKAIDGTSVKLMDTPENQAKYPQPPGQKPGCGFPVMGVVGVLDLARGTLSNYITCPYTQHDIKGFYQLREQFEPFDVAIGDRAFCSYEMVSLQRIRGVDSVMRLHQARNGKADWKGGKRIDANSRLVTWRKPRNKGKAGLSNEEWSEIADTMQVRYVRVKTKGRDGRKQTLYLITTLLDAEQYPTEEIAELYAQRWSIEVKIRDIKTTMNFEMIRVKTPKMAHRTLKMIQIAYNLVKARQAEAIRGEPILLDEVGFKGTLDLLNENRSEFAGQAAHPRRLEKLLGKLEKRLRERVIPIRPLRQEPRAVKTRPKSYQYLTAPRHEFQEIPHRERYRAAA